MSLYSLKRLTDRPYVTRIFCEQLDEQRVFLVSAMKCAVNQENEPGEGIF